MVSYLVRSWRGEELLWKTFWISHVLLGVVMFTLGLSLAFFSLALSGIAQVAVPLAFAGVYLAYLGWVHVALWRCAFNCSHAYWGYLGRAAMVLGAAGYLYFFALPLLPR